MGHHMGKLEKRPPILCPKIRRKHCTGGKYLRNWSQHSSSCTRNMGKNTCAILCWIQFWLKLWFMHLIQVLVSLLTQDTLCQIIGIEKPGRDSDAIKWQKLLFLKMTICLFNRTQSSDPIHCAKKPAGQNISREAEVQQVWEQSV